MHETKGPVVTQPGRMLLFDLTAQSQDPTLGMIQHVPLWLCHAYIAREVLMKRTPCSVHCSWTWTLHSMLEGAAIANGQALN
jgi:hypothetical protein